MTRHTAFPDLLGRDDVEHGPWEVQTGKMAAGMAWTAIGERKMSVPHGDNDNERTVRAHEMMHAKVSPKPEDMLRWFARGKASAEALTAAEELRVNTLIKRAGFNVDCLTDGSETVAGERLTEANDWRSLVLACAAYGNTGRIKSFLVGVRRNNPEWAKVLRAFHDRLAKEINKVNTAALASTGVDHRDGFGPVGYRYTEAIAVLLEHAAQPPEQPEQDNPGEQQPEAGEQQPERERPAPPPVTEDEIKKLAIQPDNGFWDDIRWEHPRRTKRAPGGIGTRKKASATGRAPTRVARLATDPYKRVFDRKVRGKGGVVLIDASASMKFTHADIKAIVEAAPGCTVAMYCGDSTSRRDGLPNMWLLADKGQMVDEIPARRSGNGVDYPAICWAVGARQHASTPVVWITDGMCHGPGQRYTDPHGVDCARAALSNGVVVRPTVATAIDALRSYGKGKKPPAWFPVYWRESWRKTFGGRSLPNQISLPTKAG